MSIFDKVFKRKELNPDPFFHHYTPESQEILDKNMDEMAERSANYMAQEYKREKLIFEIRFGKDAAFPFVHIPIIPPFVSVILVHPGQRSRHADGGYEKMVMELYKKHISEQE